jgi:glucose/arabinose dehydrogenase
MSTGTIERTRRVGQGRAWAALAVAGLTTAPLERVRLLIRFSAAVLLAVVALAAVGTPSALSVGLPPGFQDEVAFEGLSEPTNMRFASDGKVFVTEKAGRVLVFDSLSDTSPSIFADLRTEVYDGGDRGVLGLALDPEFPIRPYVYVLYTYDHLLGEAAPAPKWGAPNQAGDPCPSEAEGACPVSGRLVRLTAEGNHAVEAGGVPAEKVLVEDWCQQFPSHSIGDLQFGPEGALFASGGDGASYVSEDYGQIGWPQKNQCGDPPGVPGEELTPPTAEGGALRSQNTKNLNGSVIRIDPDTGEGLPGNPMYADLNANRRRIVAYGFRNPFRFVIDSDSNEVYAANVGWGSIEEIDRFSTIPGTPYNSGWPCYEGDEHTSYESLGLDVCESLYSTPGSTALPFFFYAHEQKVTPEDECDTQLGSAVSGLQLYRGDVFPAAYDGALFFADSVRQCFYVMFRGEDGRPDPSTTMPFLVEGGLYPGVDLEEGPEGALYYTKLFDESYGPDSGTIHRITYSSGNQTPVARLAVDHQFGAPPPLTVHFDASGSTDADGDLLSFEWDLDGDGTFEPATNNETKTETFNDSVNHTIAVRVSDPDGASSVARVTVYPGDTPPTPQILTPAALLAEPGKASLEWHVGQAIDFEGDATDAEDGTLPSTSLDWNTRLYHCPSACHAHPLQAFPAVASGTLVAPDHEYPSLIEFTLTATDARGLTATRAIKAYAHGATVTVESEPPGVSLTAAGKTSASPMQITAIEGSRFSVVAPTTAVLGGKNYVWSGWSDAGARIHTAVAAAGTLTASYVLDGAPVPAAPAAPPALGPPAPLSVRLSGHPAKRTHRTTARFSFSSDPSKGRFRCALDRRPTLPCRSPHRYRRLAPGEHRFRVFAVDDLMQSAPASWRWTVLPARGR